MHEITNKVLLEGNKFMPEMHLKQTASFDKSAFTYSACGSFTKKKERIQKFKETGNSRYIYRNELEKACFQYDMAYGGFKDLARRTASDKLLRDKAFNIAKNPKHDGYQRGLDSMVYNFFNKKGLLHLQIDLLKAEVLNLLLNKMLKNCINQSLENLKNEM